MFKELKIKIKDILLPSDGKLYYGSNKGGFSFWRLLFWNLLRPGRLYNRLRFNQLFKINFINISKFKRELKRLSKTNCTPENYTENEIFDKFNEFLNNGAVVIKNYFSEKKMNAFLNKYHLEIERLRNLDPDTKKRDGLESQKHNSLIAVDDEVTVSKYFMEYLNFSDELIDLYLDPYLIAMISSFFGRTCIARNYPWMSCTMVTKSIENSRMKYEKQIKTNTADDWHVDHSVLLCYHVLLEDVTVDGPHMEYIPGSTKIPNITFNCSDEAIEKLGIKPIKCIGKKGTVYFHDGNTLHRLKMVQSKNPRMACQFEFTAGSNILLDCNTIYKSLSSGFDLNKLNNLQRVVLKGIFPKVHQVLLNHIFSQHLQRHNFC